MIRLSLDVTAVPLDPRGAGRYTLELARALSRRDDIALTLIARSADATRWSSLAPAASVLAAAPGPRPLRLAWEQWAMPGVLARQPLDVHHGPHYTMPERARLPMVVTVHDLTFFDHPDWHERSKVPFFRRAIRHAAARADVLVCVSHATARRLEDLLHPRAQVVVAPHGIDHAQFHPGPALGEDLAGLAGAGITPPYVAFLGTVEPRKGLDLLVAAFDRVAEAHPDHRLVVAGGRGWGAGPVESAIAAMAHPSRLVRTGYLADDVVPALLRQASVVVYPARAEGFGLPVVEAMACGTPVITTAGSVMDELADGAAATFPAEDVGALADLIDAALSGSGIVRRQETVRRGIEVASRYTWAASAEAHVNAYRLAIGRGSRPYR
ncbi:MAG: glycosyltransferase family 4 protein [Acidimicrobiales bacterium]